MLRLVLKYLIPIRMTFGIMPSKSIFDNFESLKLLYEGFTTAIKRGDVRSYENLLAESDTQLMKNGSYFTIESARILAFRSVLKKV